MCVSKCRGTPTPNCSLERFQPDRKKNPDKWIKAGQCY
jgi:hypothetical protein